MRHTTEGLRRETQSLSTALRKPQVRGRWGELHLRRAVELAGLVDRCDFAEQVRLDDGALRPDLVVRLVGGRSVVVDAKVPLDAYLDATATDDDAERERPPGPARRGSCAPTSTTLGAKRYWRVARPETPGVRGAVRARPSRSSRRRWRPTRPDRVRRGAPGRAGDPDHADRAAAHGRARLEPRGAGRPGARDPPARPRAARAAGQHERPPRPARAARSTPPSAHYNQAVGLAGVAGAGAARRRRRSGHRRPAGPRQVETAARSAAAAGSRRGAATRSTGASCPTDPGGAAARAPWRLAR